MKIMPPLGMRRKFMKNFTFEPLSKVKRKMILDTDIGPDCDDVGALAVLFYLKKQYGFELPAIINCTSNKYGNGTLDALINYFGEAESNIKLGQYSAPGFLDEDIHKKYNKHVSENYSPAFMNGTLKVYDAYELYKSTLEEAEDDSIVIVTIGQFTALRKLVENDSDLIKKKVHAMVSMAGAIPAGTEYNIDRDGEAGKVVIENFPCPVIFIPFELGVKFTTGVATAEQKGNPIYDSYMLYTSGSGLNASWDLATVHFAVVGEDKFYRISAPGRMEIELPNGNNKWIEDENGTQAYLVENCPPQEIGDELNRMIASFDAK